MKKAITFVLLLTAITSYSQITGSLPIQYAEGVEIDFKSFINSVTTQYGNGTDHRVYIARGGRFKTAQMKISNNTSQDAEIDFGRIFLLDSSGNKYYVHFVLQAMKVATTGERLKLNLKAGKSKTFAAEFWPPFPKGEKVEKLEINGEVVELIKG